jgi:hypothetical protein
MALEEAARVHLVTGALEVAGDGDRLVDEVAFAAASGTGLRHVASVADARKGCRGENGATGGSSMADSHGHAPDPNAAPMHSEVKESFSTLDIAICMALALIAIGAGTICGIIFVNN